MIPRINWGITFGKQYRSPFAQDNRERPIRLTLHSSTFSDVALSQKEMKAINTLYELANLPEVDLLDTDNSDLPHIELGETDEENDQIDVRVFNMDNEIVCVTNVTNVTRIKQIAASMLTTSLSDPEVEPMSENLVSMIAHNRLNRDIFVTSSRQILHNRRQLFTPLANPRDPIDAARVVGLFLRSRDNYTWSTEPPLRKVMSRSQFYWVLCRTRLPSMWRYFAACVRAADEREDDIAYLGQSILNRSMRAIQARDTIGCQFYAPQSTTTKDIIIYHFNYLTLLLSGVLDAQARVACRSYTLKNYQGRDEYKADFRFDNFKDDLETDGAESLLDVVRENKFTHLNTLLRPLRNTIHGAGFPMVTYMGLERDEISLVEILPAYVEDICAAANKLEGTERWGIIRPSKQHTYFEPYSYAYELVEECLYWIDQIAAATDVTGLFPENVDLPKLRDKPPRDNLFDDEIRERISILG